MDPKNQMLAACAFSALLFSAPAFAGTSLTGTTASIPRQTLNGGGGVSTGWDNILAASAGEVGITAFSGVNFAMQPGLMNIAAQPGTVTAITALSNKTTGTLELAWTAPGLDGPLGKVTGGYYRIDASSDPLHVFDPAVFTASYSVTGDIVPGSLQSYLLTGLLPNTTYYTRVYLADARKAASETSATGADSTWANLPAAPVVSGVYSSSVTISWALPAGGASGYQVDSSSDSGFTGGTVTSSSTPSGAALTLTVAGLVPNTTYFFKLSSLNWQQDRTSMTNVTDFLKVCTLLGGPVEIAGLKLTTDAFSRTVTLEWSNQPFMYSNGVLIQVSTNPITSTVTNGAAYADNLAFPDGSVAKSVAVNLSSYSETVELDVPRWYNLYSKDTANIYSSSVSLTSIMLDLPPMAPAGVYSSLSADRTKITLYWSKVTSNADGTAFRNPASSSTWDISGYVVLCASGSLGARWEKVGEPVPAGDTSVTVSGLNPKETYFYKVVPEDSLNNQADSGMIVSNQGDLFAVVPSTISTSYLRISASVAAMLQPSGNPSGKSLLVRGSSETVKDSNVLKSVAFNVFEGDSGKPAALSFPSNSLEVALHYGRDANGEPIGEQAVASDSLAAYWHNGREYMKVFGRVDPAAQTVSLRTSAPGKYQLRRVARSQGVDFNLASIPNKAITPNNDGRNDIFQVVFDNPNASDYSGKIFDIRGAFVSDMSEGTVSGYSLKWDGKANGRTVSRGVYIYQVQGEGKTFNGTVLVIR
ncbi:MAG: fibronectin type III domain-containing protein [Elusimicrobia bacterium]|nr:fibronectin type III domain-containing protein [Elusimicrobiota bacterium]